MLLGVDLSSQREPLGKMKRRWRAAQAQKQQPMFEGPNPPARFSRHAALPDRDTPPLKSKRSRAPDLLCREHICISGVANATRPMVSSAAWAVAPLQLVVARGAGYCSCCSVYHAEAPPRSPLSLPVVRALGLGCARPPMLPGAQILPTAQ